MGPVTVADLLTIADDGYIYEVVEGVLVRMAGSGRVATILAAEMVAVLRNFVRPRRLGRVTGSDGVYKFAGAETGLIPDAGFYTAERDATIPPADDEKPIPFAPDLAVEVASPDQNAAEMAAKARLYLAGGTRLVWVVWPQAQHIDVWHPDTTAGPVATLNTTATLDGEEVLPGFTYPVAELFADPLA
jgi:Uma2 family endonuclease